MEAEARETERKDCEARRRHELQMKRLELEAAGLSHKEAKFMSGLDRHVKFPKLPPFQDGKDDLDSITKAL